jgi:outer membrane receptor protein involved in Fe transport
LCGALFALSALLLVSPSSMADAPVQLGTIAVIGTGGPEMPSTVISADELRSWGASDLAQALSLVAGTTTTQGSDAGPAGIGPGLVGAREADDYLLVVDGVPLGGTTAPPFESISLADVERIVVRRGPDPVIYGSSAFAGAVYIYHYPAGRSAQSLSAEVGSYGSREVTASLTLPSGETFRQSASAVIQQQRYSDPRGAMDRYQFLYRAAADVGGGALGVDVGLLDLRQTPLSPTPVTDAGLSPDVAVDSNQNPLGAHSNEYRTQLTLNYLRTVASASWASTVSLTHVDNAVLQGFLGDDPDDGDDADDPVDADNAQGYSQERRLNEAYIDSHLTWNLDQDAALSLGANDMYSNGEAHSSTFDYFASLTGSMQAAPGDVDDSPYASDKRNFFGVYLQSSLRLLSTLSADIGLRENIIDESRLTSSDDDGVEMNDRRDSRLSEGASLRWRAVERADATLTPYVAYADTFQPSQFDFSPDPDDSAFLLPETAHSWQLGVRGSAADLEWDLSGTAVEFGNAVTAEEVAGLPSFVNAGSDSFRDIDLDVDERLSDSLRLTFSYEYVDARYRSYNLVDDDGDNVSLAGKRLPLTPNSVSTLGLLFGRSEGLSLAVLARYRGHSYLDQENQIPANGFVTYDCKLSYSGDGWTIYLSGQNLSDRRDPVSASEIGDDQVYRLFGRRLEFGVITSL